MNKKAVFLLVIIGLSIRFVMAEGVVFNKQSLMINGITLSVEVAATDEQRYQGLMNRQQLAKGMGMLFKWESDMTPCFWMKSTFIPLSLGFITKDYQLVQIEPLYPEDESYICAKQPIRYALEVPQGWFAEQRITVGMSVEGINHSAL